MKKVIVFLLIVLFGDGFCQSTLPESKSVREGYKDSLQKLVKKFKQGKKPRARSIVFCIPETSEEATLFYSLDYQKESSDSFHSISEKVFELVIDGNEAAMKKYLVLSQFVDGYFAEDYFDNFGKIIRKQPELFCKAMDDTPKEKTKRLAEYRTQAGCH